MADLIEILDKRAPGLPVGEVKDGVRAVELTASTRTNEDDPDNPGKKKSITKAFTANIPTSLNSAVEVLGEKAVYRLFVNSLVVDVQSTVRKTLEAQKPGEGRKKAKYLEDLGL